MPISAARLSAALAVRLDPVVPRPFRVRAAGSRLALDHPEERGSLMGLDGIEEPGWLEAAAADVGPERAEAELYARWVANTLDRVADDVSEALREPWPPHSTPRQAAPPHARYDDRAVYLWYGVDERAPVIAFAPIPLDELV